MKKKEKKGNIYFAFPRILKTFVPQAGHSPFAAFMPFFMVTSLEFFISTSFLHFIHLPFGIKNHPRVLLDDKNTRVVYKRLDLRQNWLKSAKMTKSDIYKYLMLLCSSQFLQNTLNNGLFWVRHQFNALLYVIKVLKRRLFPYFE